MSRASEAVLLKDHLKELRLPAMRRDYAECARQARETRASYEGFLLDLVSRQLEQRRANQLERRLKQARFPVMKTLEKTDLALWPTLDGVEVRELTECTWISEREECGFDRQTWYGQDACGHDAGSGGLPARPPGWVLQCFGPGQHAGGGPGGKTAGASVSKAQSLFT